MVWVVEDELPLLWWGRLRESAIVLRRVWTGSKLVLLLRVIPHVVFSHESLTLIQRARMDSYRLWLFRKDLCPNLEKISMMSFFGNQRVAWQSLSPEKDT